MKNSMQLKKGDRVVCTGSFANVSELIGKKGKVVSVRTDSTNSIGVEFDESFDDGHNCDGAGNPRHCRWGEESSLKLDKNMTIKKLGAMMKKLLDSNTQTLVKAGFINGDLELTEEGIDALNVLCFDAYKTELVAMAQAKIDEEKADKKD